jgi:hypothetical protein
MPRARHFVGNPKAPEHAVRASISRESIESRPLWCVAYALLCGSREANELDVHSTSPVGALIRSALGAQSF